MKLKLSSVIAFSVLQVSLALAGPKPLPPSRECYGVIELGAKGIKSLVMHAPKDTSGNLISFTPVAEPKEFPPVNKDPYKGDTAKQVMDELVLIREKMMANFGLLKENIYVVESSGIPKDVKDILSSKLPSGIIEDSIDVSREARLVFQGIVPTHRRHLDEVVVLDIGSGNSKGAYLTAAQEPVAFETFSIPLGTGTFSKKVAAARKPGDTFKTIAEVIAQDEILAPLEQQIKEKPGMLNCSRLYLAGGLPYVMSTLLHPESIDSKDPEDPSGQKSSDWVKLSSADIKKFHELATTKPEDLLKVDYSKVPTAKRANAEAKVKEVSAIFEPEQLTAGAILLKAYMDKMNFDKKDAIFFSRQALYAWPQGYLKEKLQGK